MFNEIWKLCYFAASFCYYMSGLKHMCGTYWTVGKLEPGYSYTDNLLYNLTESPKELFFALTNFLFAIPGQLIAGVVMVTFDEPSDQELYDLLVNRASSMNFISVCIYCFFIAVLGTLMMVAPVVAWLIDTIIGVFGFRIHESEREDNE